MVVAGRAMTGARWPLDRNLSGWSQPRWWGGGGPVDRRHRTRLIAPLPQLRVVASKLLLSVAVLPSHRQQRCSSPSPTLRFVRSHDKEDCTEAANSVSGSSSHWSRRRGFDPIKLAYNPCWLDGRLRLTASAFNLLKYASSLGCRTHHYAELAISSLVVAFAYC